MLSQHGLFPLLDAFPLKAFLLLDEASNDPARHVAACGMAKLASRRAN